MTLDALLKDYAYFNLWAHHRLVDWLRTKPAERLEQETPSSFPTLKLTFLHLWAAEKIWMERLQQIPTAPFLALTFNGSSEVVCTGLLQNAAASATYIDAQDAPYFEAECDFQLLDGTVDRRPRTEMLLHCLQHSTYHRGQIITMARALGITDPPKTDYIAYARLRDQGGLTFNRSAVVKP